MGRELASDDLFCEVRAVALEAAQGAGSSSV
jgi:hypothetical protein